MVDTRRRGLDEQLGLSQVRTHGGTRVGAGVGPTVARLAAQMRNAAGSGSARGSDQEIVESFEGDAGSPIFSVPFTVPGGGVWAFDGWYYCLGTVPADGVRIASLRVQYGGFSDRQMASSGRFLSGDNCEFGLHYGETFRTSSDLDLNVIVAAPPVVVEERLTIKAVRIGNVT